MVEEEVSVTLLLKVVPVSLRKSSVPPPNETVPLAPRLPALLTCSVPPLTVVVPA